MTLELTRSEARRIRDALGYIVQVFQEELSDSQTFEFRYSIAEASYNMWSLLYSKVRSQLNFYDSQIASEEGGEDL